ncbi:MAG: hypothetical protein H0S80_10695 [Desulfovibrionaceae bacterium]|nr:hypothetical protein [Desulfovibrionaceae bacterium]
MTKINTRIDKLEQWLRPKELVPDEALKVRLNRTCRRLGWPEIEGPVYRSTRDPAERLKGALERFREAEDESLS